MSTKYSINCSEVAALIGRNPYQPVPKAIMKFLKRNNWKQFRDLLQTIDIVEIATMTSNLLSKDKVLRIWYGKASKATDTEALEKCFATVFKIVDEMETPYDEATIELIKQELKSMIQKKRGNLFEKKGINQYEKKTNRVVTARNSEMFEKTITTTSDYTVVIRAKVDGIDRENDCLIEHKNRVRRLFEEIPDYEKVQLEIYMRLTGLSSCKLG